MFFGPLLTHSSHVTFPWQPLRHALHTYFGSGPASLDPVRTATRAKGHDLTLEIYLAQDQLGLGRSLAHPYRLQAARTC